MQCVMASAEQISAVVSRIKDLSSWQQEARTTLLALLATNQSVVPVLCNVLPDEFENIAWKILQQLQQGKLLSVMQCP